MSDTEQQPVTAPIEDPFTLVLKKPVTMKTIEYTELTLTEPTVGQVEQAAGKTTAIASHVLLISLVAKVPESVVRLMDNSDFKTAARYLENFL